jgi:hypothetical protein
VESRLPFWQHFRVDGNHRDRKQTTQIITIPRRYDATTNATNVTGVFKRSAAEWIIVPTGAALIPIVPTTPANAPSQCVALIMGYTL